MDPFEITHSRKFVKIGKHLIQIRVENINFSRLGNNAVEISEEAAEIFDRMLAAVLKKYSVDPSKTKFSLKIMHPSLDSTIDGIYLNYRTIDRINGNMIMNLLTRYQNSSQSLQLDRDFTMEMHLFNTGLSDTQRAELSKEETAQSQFVRHVE